MGFKVVNFFDATLQQAIADDATTAYIEPAQEDLLPTLTGGDVVRVVLYDGSQEPEIVDITAHSGGAVTIDRAKEGTVAGNWAAGTRVTCDLTAALVEAVLNTATLNRFTGTATGTNDITVTMSGGSTLPVPAAGDEVFFQIPSDNTGAVTLTVDNGDTSVGPTAVVHEDGEPLEPGDIQSGWFAEVKYHAGFSKWVLTSQASNQLHADQINDGPVPGANRKPNGDFSVWTGGSSFSTPSSGAAVCDDYYVEYDGTIGAFTFSRQTFTLGQTDVLGQPKYYARWAQGTAGTGSSYRRLRTKFPGVERFAGRKVIRSIWLKADSARTVTAKLLQNFGTGGSPSSEVEAASESWSVTTSWQRFEIADELPSISGKTLGSDGNDALILSLDLPVNTTMTIEFAMDQFEPGHIASFPDARLPWSPLAGGTGRSYANFAALVAGIVAGIGGDLAALEAQSGTGLVARTADATYAQRTLTGGTGLSVTNGDGVSGNPTVSLGTALSNYNADPLSVAELASITGNFGTAAFKNTGTSGDAVALCNGANTWAAAQTYTAKIASKLADASDWILEFQNASGTNQGGIWPGAGYSSIVTPGFGAEFKFNDDGTAAFPGGMTLNSSAVLTAATGAQLAAANTFTDGQVIAADYPFLDIYDTDGGSNAKNWRLDAGAGVLAWYAISDDFGTFNKWFSISRSSATPTVAEFDICDLRIEPSPSALATNSAGFRGFGEKQSKTADFTFALADAGKLVQQNSASSEVALIPTNASVAFPIGNTAIPVENIGAGTMVLTPDTGVTLYDETGASGAITLSQHDGGVLYKTDTNTWRYRGSHD